MDEHADCQKGNTHKSIAHSWKNAVLPVIIQTVNNIQNSPSGTVF